MSPIASVVIALLIGIAIGYIISRLISKPKVITHDSSYELEQSRLELEQYKQQVKHHFDSSAKLLEDMAQQYQSVFQHMAIQSQSLIDNREQLPELFADFKQAESESETQSTQADEQAPKDYSNQPSGIFSQEQKKAS